MYKFQFALFDYFPFELCVIRRERVARNIEGRKFNLKRALLREIIRQIIMHVGENGIFRNIFKY